ncbi:MAG: glycosyltransferase family 4 protein [Vicinamibacterales bacterium]
MARSVYLLARDVRHWGVRPHLVLHREGRLGRRLDASGLSYDIVPELIETGLRGHAPDDRGVGALLRNVGQAPRAVVRLREIAMRVGASVIYAHGTWSSYLAAGAGMVSPEPPIVWHVRNDHSAARTRWGGRTLARLGGVRAIIAVSESAAWAYRGSRSPVHVVLNGVDLSAANAATMSPVPRGDLGIGADPDATAVVVGFAGRLAAHKGIGVLMSAFAIAARQLPALHLVVMGESARYAAADQIDRLRAQAAAMGLAARVHLSGYVEPVESYLAACDLVVVPSVCRDSCPRTAIEALAVGTPVVASRIGGIPEIVRDGVTGRLVTPNSPAALADALVDLGSSADRRRAMGAAARNDAAERFDSRRTAARVAQILHGICGSTAAPAAT